MLKLCHHLAKENVLIAPAVAGREELFRAFADLLAGNGLVPDPDAVVAGLEQREAILSTGIGGGVAAPHTQLAGVGRLVVAASTHPDGLDYPALDGRPIRVVLCLVADAAAAADHLAGLARIARIARRPEAVERLATAPDPAAFVGRLAAFEGEA